MQRFAAVFVTVLLLGFVTEIYGAKPVSADSSPFVLTMTTSHSKLSQGEPIPIRYELRNVNNKTVYCSDRNEEGISFRFRIKSQQGQIVDQDNRPFPTPNPSGVRVLISLSPGAVVSGTLYANVGSGIKTEGKYTLQADLQFLYHHQGQYKDTAFTNSVSMPLAITKRDDALLKTVAKNLRVAALKTDGQDASARQEAVKALFRMPEDVAFPYWESVIKNSAREPSVTKEMIDQLATNATATSVKLLIALSRRTFVSIAEVPTYEAGEARGALLEIYRNGPEALRPRIKQVFLQQTGKTPESIPHLIPSNAD